MRQVLMQQITSNNNKARNNNNCHTTNESVCDCNNNGKQIKWRPRKIRIKEISLSHRRAVAIKRKRN